jgi:hypothetical protein
VLPGKTYCRFKKHLQPGVQRTSRALRISSLTVVRTITIEVPIEGLGLESNCGGCRNAYEPAHAPNRSCTK